MLDPKVLNYEGLQRTSMYKISEIVKFRVDIELVNRVCNSYTDGYFQLGNHSFFRVRRCFILIGLPIDGKAVCGNCTKNKENLRDFLNVDDDNINNNK